MAYESSYVKRTINIDVMNILKRSHIDNWLKSIDEN